MSIRRQWQRLMSWDQQRWGRFTAEGWVQITRTPRQFADCLRNLPESAADGVATTAGTVATSEID
ncbi:MAG: hypothetical protein WDO12_07045 [Pseudomonadota bacterium]